MRHLPDDIFSLVLKCSMQIYGDADFVIVSVALQFAETSETIVVGYASDFCIIMQALFTICSTSIQRQRQGNSRGTWIIHRAKAKLREQVCQHLLFVHTILGCDTTSRLFGFRKAILLKLIQTSQTFIEQGSNIQPRGVVISCKRQLCAYTRQVCALNNLKHQKFSDLIQTSRKAIQPKQLPPM